jgi:hypothetical protein
MKYISLLTFRAFYCFKAIDLSNYWLVKAALLWFSRTSYVRPKELAKTFVFESKLVQAFLASNIFIFNILCTLRMVCNKFFSFGLGTYGHGHGQECASSSCCPVLSSSASTCWPFFCCDMMALPSRRNNGISQLINKQHSWKSRHKESASAKVKRMLRLCWRLTDQWNIVISKQSNYLGNSNIFSILTCCLTVCNSDQTETFPVHHSICWGHPFNFQIVPTTIRGMGNPN